MIRLLTIIFMGFIAAAATRPLWAASPPDANEELKQEYTQFAELFSMRTNVGYFSEYRLEAPVRAAATAPMSLSHPALVKSREEFLPISVMYLVAQKALNKVQFNPQEIDQMRKLGFEGLFDDEKEKEYLSKALQGMANQVQAKAFSDKLLEVAMQRHAASWKTIVPLAKMFAGSERIETPLRFTFSTVTSLPAQYELRVTNTSGQTLTNATILVRTNISNSLKGDAKQNFVFVPRWSDQEDISLYYSLVDAFPKIGSPRPTKKCLSYSIWSDQTFQENVILEMRAPEPLDLSPPSYPRNERVKRFVGYAFDKESDKSPIQGAADLLTTGSIWKGTMVETEPHANQKNIEFIVTKREGKKFKAEIKFANVHLRDVEGTLNGGAISWQGVAKQRDFRHDPGQPTTGLINRTRIETSYSGKSAMVSKTTKGTVSLVLDAVP